MPTKIKTTFILLIYFTTNIFSQVGINTKSPIGWFHVDPKQNTTTVNEYTLNDSDDFVIANDGNVGIGTAKPSNKLTIRSGGDDSGLLIKKGASDGYVLSSGSEGNTEWRSTTKHLFTYLNSSGGKTCVNTSTNIPYVLMTGFYASLDQIKNVYGNEYGWNNTTKQFKVPLTGKYRIVINGYFNSTGNGRNHRIYAYLNNKVSLRCGMVSITDPGGDISSYNMSIVVLTKGDVIDFRIGSIHYKGNQATCYYASSGHTFAYIEALDNTK